MVLQARVPPNMTSRPAIHAIDAISLLEKKKSKTLVSRMLLERHLCLDTRN